TQTRVVLADKQGFHTEAALPFFLERYADAYRLQLDKFLEAVAGRDFDIPTGSDGLKALQIADAAQESLQRGSPVPL
ncbi:MAG TPA: Gfo/Idh/MocA family oxidoreductase, partial [Xanthomonadales bacterium]|nr:Gfo/Idh/MocA family oxidoreductase [Xanthomonadales bacterium]